MGLLAKLLHISKHPIIELSLEGVCRFILNEHFLTPDGYYQANIETQDYQDMNNLEPQIDRTNLIQKYSNFFKMKKLEIDQEVLSETSNLQLLSTLAMLAPLTRLINK